jgi:GNAT superfamily N-acetyltransferase
VLKRCVYGVDLNPMAVELAKVSLWLDAFTLGAPLSFLDHHLRCGNSLIGAMAHEADEEMRRGDKQQLTFLEGPFVGLLRSAEIMRGIGMLADATMEQAQESATLFRQFERAARPYKQFLDVYVMRDFGVKRADEFLRVHGVEKMQASLKTLSPPYRQLLAEREAMYRDHRFFHWDLEFPEVFIDLGRSTWKQYPGFDGVVGNPPYLGFHRGSAAERAYYRSTFASAVGKYDQYIVFVEKALQLASISGREGMITPNRFLTTEYGQGLRHQMIELCKDVSILDFGDSEVFEDSTTYPSINFCTRKDVLESHPCRVRYIKSSAEEQSKGALPEPLEGRKVEREDFLQGRNLNVTMGVATILDALEGRVCTMRLGDMTTGIFQGIRTGEQSLYYVPLGVAESHGLEDCALRVALANSHVERYHILADEAGQFRLIYPYDLRAGEAISMSETKISNILAYLRQFKQRLAKRKNSGRSFEQTDLAWWEIWDPCPMWAQPRIVVPDISDHNRFALDAQGRFAPLNIIYSIVLDPEYRNIGYGALLALLNSKLIESFIRSVSRAQRGGYYRYQTRLMMQIPIPIKGIVDVQVAGNRLTTEVHNLYMNRDYEGVLRNLPLQPLPEGERSHHDLLTFLSERMMEMQQEKHAEAHHFLSESELYLGTSIDDLSGKTIIQNYLGDYQKDEPELPWDELLHRLQSNRSKIRANLSDPALLHRLREAYEASLATLLPIKQRLRETDWLIDQVVYKLYGLSDEEIAIVEGRG